jgi:hypothetical protein
VTATNLIAFFVINRLLMVTAGLADITPDIDFVYYHNESKLGFELPRLGNLRRRQCIGKRSRRTTAHGSSPANETLKSKVADNIFFATLLSQFLFQPM